MVSYPYAGGLQSMFCTHCGTNLDSSANFCPHCGIATKPGQPYPPKPPRPLFRLASDKKIAGICSGLAYYLNMDVTLFRIIFVAVTIATGVVPFLLAYLIAWPIMPLGEPLPPREAYTPPSSPTTRHPEDSSTSATLVG
jgi:phage shock protein PspC (stress-responsive transcriptional regulator)